MHEMRRGVTLSGLLGLALVPVGMAMLAGEAPAPAASLPVAMTRTMTLTPAVVVPPVVEGTPGPDALRESGLLLLVGGTLLGIAAVVKRTTGAR